MENNIIEIHNLSRSFGDNKALNNINLIVPEGVVFGLVGKNGAGKTTIIKHIMGLLEPQTGSSNVFGLSPITNPVETLSRIGYMGETDELPSWMYVKELINYRKAFFPNWDNAYAEEIIEAFEIELTKKVKDLSKGQRARVALMLALAHKPDLLVLDEPSDGLDPVLRRDILQAVIRTVVNEGRTVLFSSHLLDEVERISDDVAVIEKGEIIYESSIEELKERFHRVELIFNTEQELHPEIEYCFEWKGSRKIWSTVYHGDLNVLEEKLKLHEGIIQKRIPLTLTDAFISMVSQNRNE